MTLNAILARLEAIITAHKQVREYEAVGLVADLENQHTRKYPVVTMIVSPGSISSSAKTTTYPVKLGFFDLVNQAEDAKTNEWDVVSDMVGIAEDIFAQIDNPNYDGWKVTTNNTLTPVFDKDGDMFAGVELDLSISTMYKSNICQPPSTLEIDNIPDNVMDRPTFDLTYIADGTEAFSLDSSVASSPLSVIKGKKVIMVSRSFGVLNKVSNLPESDQYTWNDMQVGLGTPTNPNERFVILYRNY